LSTSFLQKKLPPNSAALTRLLHRWLPFSDEIKQKRSVVGMVVDLRKNYLSVPDIKIFLNNVFSGPEAFEHSQVLRRRPLVYG
jgi:hypothetical protein